MYAIIAECNEATKRDRIIHRAGHNQWRNLHPRCPRGAGVTQIGAKWNRRKIPIILKMTLCYSCVFARNACKMTIFFRIFIQKG